jgi:hypothetical protein
VDHLKQIARITYQGYELELGSRDARGVGARVSSAA